MIIKRDMIVYFDRLAETIRNRAKYGKVIYMANPGNYGDGLIRNGTLEFFNYYGITYEEVPIVQRGDKYKTLSRGYLDFGDRNLFVYGGGGAWGNAYSFGFGMIKKLSRLTKNIVVLPSTYQVFSGRFPGIYFRRDNEESWRAAPDSIFCPDMAFFSIAAELDKPYVSRVQTKERQYLFRNDKESGLNRDIPAVNYDLSATAREADDVSVFLDHVASASLNVSDRLHIAVASLICRRKVIFVSNNYFKNRAVYEASMEGQFDDLLKFVPLERWREQRSQKDFDEIFWDDF